MSLVQLAYASRREPSDGGVLELDALLKGARTHNEKSGISGYLSFRSDFFLQLIEGPPAAITNLYGVIANDRRHSDLLILGYKPVYRRQFEKWSMGYSALSGMPHSIHRRFAETDLFAPHLMSFRSARAYLVSMDEWSSQRAESTSPCDK